MTIRPYIENLDKALYEKGSNEKKTNAKIEQITAQLISRLGELPEIGKNDKALNDFWYSKYPYKIRNGIIFDGEKKYNGSELARRAKAFMGELWSNQQNIVSDGGRGDNIFGEEVTFVAKDKKSLSSPYRVSITNTGGHIVSVQLGDQKGMKYDEPAGKMDKKAAVLYAQEFIGRWGEESLELHQFEDKTSIYRLVFVPIKENIPVIQQKVEIVIDPVKGRLVQFDASNYFRYYKQDFPLRPKLSPEEAANKLNKTLRISGAPVLEVKDGDLVYAIPVKGIDLVRHIYINAINGDEEGFDYVT
jgi:hypothetical protein